MLHYDIILEIIHNIMDVTKISVCIPDANVSDSLSNKIFKSIICYPFLYCFLILQESEC